MHTLVLFDIDGTILNSSGAGRRAMEGALSVVFGTPGSPEFRYDGKTDKQIIRELMRLEGFDDALIDAKMDDVIRLYLTNLGVTLNDTTRTVRVFPGVAELIDEIHARDDAVLGLLTGNVLDGASLKLGRVGLDVERFRVNAFGSDHEVRRELPAIAQRRMFEVFGVDLAGDRVIVIGDTPADIDCGRGIGARAIAVATGRYSLAELQEHQPHAAFQDLSDTAAVLEAIYD